ncbi:MAG: tetratricopeptide repeat protein [Pirellulales bacterium]
MSTSAFDPFEIALAHARAGRWQQAAEHCRQILAANPRHAASVDLLGLVALNGGDQQQAIKLFSGAIRLDGARAAYHDHLGEACRAAGMFHEARASYLRALELAPGFADAHFHLALLHRIEGDAPAAIERCRAALASVPAHSPALQLLAAAQWALRDLAGAMASYEQLLAAEPANLEALVALGTLAFESGRGDQARAYYNRALAVQPRSAELHVRLGDVDAAEQQWPSAMRRYEAAIELDPNSAVAECHLATVLQATGAMEAAVTHYRRAVELSPRYVTAQFNLGTALDALGLRAEAATHYEAAIALDPTSVDAHLNLGAFHQEQGQYDAALACYDRAIAQAPQSAEAHFNRGLVLLAQGDLAAAWPEYEWRAGVPDFPLRAIDLPRWNGAAAPDATLLVHTEQGLGDTLQFVRYVPLIAQRCRRVVLLAHPPLVSLLQQSGFADVYGYEADLPPADLQVPLMSLPGIVGTTFDNVPAPAAYLSTAAERVAAWHDRLRDVTGFRVGISWQGAPTNRRDAQRSVPLAAFAPLAEVPGVRLVSLQRRDGTEQLDALGGRFEVVRSDDDSPADEQLLNVAAAMKNLDLVITIDSAVAHLAGGLGVPVWVALPAQADWRWRTHGDQTPWYSTMRLFRQSRPGDWADVFLRLAAALDNFVDQAPRA